MKSVVFSQQKVQGQDNSDCLECESSPISLALEQRLNVKHETQFQLVASPLTTEESAPRGNEGARKESLAKFDKY